MAKKSKKLRTNINTVVEKTPATSIPPYIIWPALLAIALGAMLRLYQITRNDFFFFDAGMYLNYGRILFEPFSQATSRGLADYLTAIQHWLVFAFRTDRPLWQLLVDLRIFWGGTEDWAYIRILSACMGIATIGITYLFAKKLFHSKTVGLLSAAILALMPSHVFYSRLGLPEATTTLFFILGLYFYMFSLKSRTKLLLSSFFLVCAFFTNYRCIILPLFVIASELMVSFAEHRKPDIKKYLWSVAFFFLLVIPAAFFINPVYIVVTSHWMLHQIDLASAQFSWLNLFSYPYEIFRLENWPFGLLFFGNVYFIYKKEWLKMFPFSLVCLRMAMFSFSSDKAARYLCAVTPFMAMAAAVLIVPWIENHKQRVVNAFAAVLIIITAGAFLIKDLPIVTCHAAYHRVMKYLKSLDPDPMILTTQPLLLNLFAKDRNNIRACPNINDDTFLKLPESGYRYLVLGPQAYVEWTNDGVSFSGDLGGFLGFFDKRVEPLKTFPHINKAMLERFVFEHNQNLLKSIAFLDEADEHTGDLRVYDFPKGIAYLKSLMNERAKAKKTY